MRRKQEGGLLGLLIIFIQVTTFMVIAQDMCDGPDTCKDCITAGSQCSWCGEVDVESTEPLYKKRCMTYEQNMLSCAGNASQVISFPVSTYTVNRDEPFTVAGADYFDNDTNIGKTVTQMKPQDITVRLRQGHPIKFNVTFQKVIDYPLDIYYVMDLSNSMLDDLIVLQNLGTELFSKIRVNVTKNVQLGFGSFVDKVMMPFASTVPGQLENPCAKQEENNVCAPAFGFRHQVNITSDSEEFNSAIQETQVSGNIDSPEGSFDALMQIAVCSHIKWRDGATHVILLTTDATPHLAMDGKLAAILQANDMKCHMKWGANSLIPDALVYSKSKTMDYPSVGQLKKVFDENRIHSIFAVTEEVADLYTNIEHVLNNAYVAQLSNDSSNIIPLIQRTYNELKGRLAISQLNVPDNVLMTTRVFCPHETEPKTNNMQCDSIVIGDEVVFEITLDSTSCPTDIHQKDSIVLKSSSIQDEVRINIEYICDCDCTNNGDTNSSRCYNHGNLKCGICECEEGRAGSLCQCSATVNGVAVTEQCKRPDKDVLCEENGVCECGTCKCDATFVGDHCECKTTGCPSNEYGVCGGADKGTCRNCDDDRRCVCHNNYTIKPNDQTCFCHVKLCKQVESSGVICNNNGACECDTCVCTNPQLYAGTYCETCIHPNCTDLTATCAGDIIRNCAECLNEKDRLGERNNPCTEECGNSFITYEYVSEFLDCSGCIAGSQECLKCAKHDETRYTPAECTSKQTDNQCDVNYEVAWLVSNQFIIYVKDFNKETDCPKPINPILIVLPVVGGIILIGLIALAIWKALQTLRDKQQYQEFLKEQDNRKWTQGTNPIFDKPTSNFANPTFVSAPGDE